MTLAPRHIVTACLLAALAAGVVWFLRSVEWADVDVQTFSKNEAGRDRYYAAKSLVRGLGGRVVKSDNLDTLPPPAATLVLSSAHWNMFPGRDAALRRWVEGGGRLVLLDVRLFGEQAIPGWTMLRPVRAPPAAGSSASAASAAHASPAVPAQPPSISPIAAPCRVLTEPDTVRPMFAQPRSYRVCGQGSAHLRSKAPAQWSLDDPDGAQMERVAVGKGSVALSSLYGAFTNENFIRDDAPLAFAALLDLHRGDAVWFVEDESREPLFEALWAHGRAALLLGLAALGLALWRGIPRFGPLAAEPSPARRSIGEQVRRTAAFIAGGDGSALHTAALKALDAAALRTVADYASLTTAASRARAIASRTGTDAAGLEAAMRSAPTRRELPAAIARIERARRALLDRPAGIPSFPHERQPTTP